MSFKDPSDEVMCNLNKRSDSQTGGSPEDTQSTDTSYGEGMTIKDTEHSLSCSGSDADLSDADKQEANENRQCPLCDKLFPNPAEYTLHLKSHTDGTKCLVCNKVLSSANSLDRHLLVHSGEKPFECQQCGKAFTTNGNMNRHKKKRKHNGSLSGPAPKKMKIVPNDNQVSNSTPISVAKVKMYDCDRCTDGFKNLIKVGLKPENFDLICRMDCEMRRTCSCKEKDNSTPLDDVEKSQVCDTCGDVCLRMSNLLSKSNSNSLYMCKDCGSGFVSLSLFRLHKLRHKISNQNQIVNCDVRNEDDKANFLRTLGLISNKELNDVKELANDKETETVKHINDYEEQDKLTGCVSKAEETVNFENIFHDSAPNHQSDNTLQVTNASSVVSLSSAPTRNVSSPLSADCASPFSNTVQVPSSPIEGSVMVNENTTDNELQCKECFQIFDTKKLQIIHYYQTHLKKSVFPCPQCEYVSKDKSTLTRHMRKHTGERPYMCIHCLKKFTTETNAKRHIKNKHKVFKMLKKHIECKSSEKPSADQGTVCHYCRKDFGDPKLLTQHKNAPDCPGKMFICGECPMRFTTKNNCIRHMMVKHDLEKTKAKESMIIDRFIPDDEKKNDRNLQRIEMILDAADSRNSHENGSLMDLESVQVEDSPKANENCAVVHGTSQIVNEVEISEVPIDMSLNCSRLASENTSEHLSIDTVRQRPSSTEVDVSYSMLRLSEEMPYPQEQEAALDLSLRPIDLTAKTEQPKQKSINIPSSISSYVMMPPPAHTTPPIISKQSSHHNLLNFLSSRSQNTAAVFPQPTYFPSTLAESFLPRPSQFHENALVSPLPSEFQNHKASCNNNPVTNDAEDSNDSEKELCIVEDTASVESNENQTSIHSPSEKQHTSECDLASVSSVIDTANSQDISKFLNTVTFNKTHSAVSELGTLSVVSKTNSCKMSIEIKKKFPCNQCNKSFDTASALKRHMVIHTGQKKHKCSTCGKAFGTKSNCKRHELTHLTKSVQKPKDLSSESQNTFDISNSTEHSNYGVTADLTDRYDYTDEMSQSNLNYSFGAGHLSSNSKMLATFSHLFPKNYCTNQNYECKFCLNSYKNSRDLTNHLKELHPSEFRQYISNFS